MVESTLLKDEFVEFTFSDTKRQLGIVFKGKYPFIDSINKGSYASELMITDDLELTKIGDYPAPDVFKEAIKLFKSEREIHGEKFTLQFRKPIDDSNFNWMQIEEFNGKKITCPKNESYISVNSKKDVEESLKNLHIGENMGTYEDNYTVNPRTKGYEGIPGEVLLIPTNYPFYKGVGKPGMEEASCYEVIDERPTWYGDKLTADIYAGPNNKLMVFRTTRPVVLINLLDHLNIDWMIRRINDLKANGKLTEKQNADYIYALKGSLMNRVRNLKNIVGLNNGKRRAISNKLLKNYITFCNKRYGPGPGPGPESDSINRYSINLLDSSLPEILNLVLGTINCDGYFSDSVPGQSGIFPREIMIIDSRNLMKIDFDNPLHTCEKSIQESETSKEITGGKYLKNKRKSRKNNYKRVKSIKKKTIGIHDSTKRKSRRKPKKLNKKRSKIQSKKKRNIRNKRNKSDYGAKVFKEDEENYPSGAPRYEVVKVPPGVQNGMKFLTGTSVGPMVVTCPAGVCQGSELKIPIPDKNVEYEKVTQNKINQKGNTKAKVPPGIYPGMSFLVDTPNGLLDVLVPPGCGPGSMVEIQIPDTKPEILPDSLSDNLSDILSEAVSDDSLFKMKKGKKKKFLLELTAL